MGRHDGLDALAGYPAPSGGPLGLNFRIGVDHENPVYQAGLSRLEQQRNDQNTIECFQLTQPFLHRAADTGVKDLLKPAPVAGIGEYHIRELRPVQAAFRIEDVAAEDAHDLLECGHSRSHQLTRQRIGVDHRNAPGVKHFSGGGFSAADPPCEAHDEHVFE